MLSGYPPATWLTQRNAPQLATRRHEECLQIRPCKHAVRRFILFKRDELQQFAFRRQNIDSALELARSLPLAVTVQSRRNKETTLRIDAEPVGSAAIFPVENHFPAGWDS